ncbi:hypothetical protein CBS115989_6001 [Aspergillus niger]|uniref:Thioredoxin-like protein n=1 Tax=Aspergillus niger ATCC 13496 TaxID=1353008 RepID=A0A370C6A2_ASPNG|nr:hypothetical protein ANI_1_992134 [Aspergillus niger CBS 513.88]KAI2817365.1 hypothetical protein CBS115989_6001 [Aspergillus niger]RDH22136.1 thioredoxin-like protein [Aspergillus niger ATCC 13496]KAI2842296.1 hypothetical protein CBS11350_5908 [Aspergillus niger]KAI2854948.1 hypothetical protein CBS11232_4595 [Aspergillus niger]KAI2872625.1 hypothetical protein CBS115988_7632 [Aspergillus niger]|eukprot:XP_001397250.2 hypothetical protein ANI_1_992134 [Aspergillus niger CBS 513.88]
MDQLNSKQEINDAIANHASFILMFTAVWSDVGNVTKEKFESIGAKYPTVYMAWVSTDDHPELAEEWGYTAIPATVGYKNGTKVEYYIGPQLVDQQVEAFIKKVV